ncbi:hypothetical protein D9757_001439 [Collybiopsis confluens]|uniref:Myb-like domain-containing protein n=1 Tax=Collybiopsis confluens TaxID=2823264 RepID=A0A8H5HZW5_9AGAR|nr:hypothetical protein D9757_001439 [Collybiopsis confluens]
MDPQYYQPLSHALNPPRSSSQPQFYDTAAAKHHKQAESDDDDEDIIEEELSRTSVPPSPKPASAAHPASNQEHEPRRRGRPKGSKNRRNRVSSGQSPVKSSPPRHQPLTSPGQGTNPPQLPEVTAQNQQYYEFQWRVLNLCAEFYGAAEELLKATPPLVIAQCYQMGPGSKVDPLNMLNEAKQKCDTLLANPSRLINSPPPPMYPVVPTFYSAPPPTTAPSGPMPASAVPVSAPAPAVISQPQSFVVSMSNSAAYPVYSQYPTTSYYQYPYGHPGAYYAPVPPPAPVSAAAPPSQAPSATVSPSSNSGSTISGAWSDEELDRLKRLADKKRNSSGEIDWDDIVASWGNARTRHQILIKATQLGLKESSSLRGVKRRREGDSNESGNTASAAPTPTPVTVAANSSSTSSTPMPSPSLQHQKQPPRSTSKAPSSMPTTSAPPPPSTQQPWPMPVVAVNTSSPVIGSAPSVTSYYRPRPPSASSPKPTSGLPPVHRYMYQPNGHQSDNTK